jgi:predicted TIM-barrel fold metal-dependent hydrolase
VSDPVYDPFWARINEAGATVVVHGGDSWCSNYLTGWGESATLESFRQNPFRTLASANPTQDTFANLLARRHFHRFPNLRIAAIETGSDWVRHLDEKLGKSWGQTPQA